MLSLARKIKAHNAIINHDEVFSPSSDECQPKKNRSLQSTLQPARCRDPGERPGVKERSGRLF